MTYWLLCTVLVLLSQCAMVKATPQSSSPTQESEKIVVPEQSPQELLDRLNRTLDRA